MVCVPWLLVMVMAHVCIPGSESACWDGTICSDMSNREALLAKLDSMAAEESNNGLLLTMLQSSIPPEEKVSQPNLKARGDERRSYSMEHFRWGKPAGRKRRPVKVFSSSLEGGGFTPQVRRQVGTSEDQEKKSTAGLATAAVKPKTRLLNPQERKDAYRMSHFRWGSPYPSKRSGGFMKEWEGNSDGLLVKLLRDKLPY